MNFKNLRLKFVAPRPERTATLADAAMQPEIEGNNIIVAPNRIILKLFFLPTKWRWIPSRAAFLIAAFILVGAGCAPDPPERRNLDVPYVPTPQHVVDRMLEMAEVGPEDHVIDLGSGDGRIVITAAQLGATGLGVDLDPERIEEAEENARRAGVSARVRFMRQDLFETDVREASVVTMYLLSEVNRRLRPRLLEELRPGARLVSYSFDMGEWAPDESDIIDGLYRVYLWVIPERIEGLWRWELEDSSFRMNVSQSFQEISVEMWNDGARLEVENARLQGPEVAIRARNENMTFAFSGVAQKDSIIGRVEIQQAAQAVLARSWKANRTASE